MGKKPFLGSPLMLFEDDSKRNVWLLITVVLYVALLIVGCHWFLSPWL
jgi:hypothetical protein